VRRLATEIATKHKYGIPIVISLAIFLGLATTDFTICWFYDYPAGAIPSVPTSGCESHTLLTKITDDRIWPLAYFPFTSYDTGPYDILDVRGWLNMDSYFPAVWIGIALYIIWFIIRYFVQRRIGYQSAEMTN
jgi:hypothetical protein